MIKENEATNESEISEEEKELFLEMLHALPQAGIGLRGDNLVRAQLLQNGLDKPNINYLVFTPPEMRPKIWGSQTEKLYKKMRGMLDMALVFADPWRKLGAEAVINDPDFTSYIDFFSKNTAVLPTITWFTESVQGQFNAINQVGRTWYGLGGEYKSGDIESFGVILPEDIKKPLILDLDDIAEAQYMVEQEIEQEVLMYGTFFEKIKVKSKLYDSKKLLKSRKKLFRNQLAKIALRKLIKEIIRQS